MKKATAYQKNIESAVKAAVLENRVQLYEAVRDNQPTFCYGNCQKLRGRRQKAARAGGDDGWKACPCCKKIWCCMNTVKCHTDFINRISFSMTASYIEGFIELSANIVNASAGLMVIMFLDCC